MKGYFAGKTCIYIDQFAASNLFDESPSRVWSDIAVLIDEKFDAGKIICPVPFEHFLESSNKHKDRAIKIDQKLHQLSSGMAYLGERMMTSRYIIALLRRRSIGQTDFFSPLKYPATISRPDVFENFQKQHATFDQNITEATSGLKEIRELLIQKKFSWKTLEPMYEALKWMAVREFLEPLEELITQGRLMVKPVFFQTGAVPDWAHFLLASLTQEHHMTLEEAKALQEMIIATGFDQIPPLDIRYSLTAYATVTHKKQIVNDHIDLIRLSTGLPASDWVFTDKQRKSELLQLGLDKKYQTELFSGSEVDLMTFREKLDLL